MLKIVHLVGWYFPESLGGTEVYVDALARRMRSLGHEVRVAAPDPGGVERVYEHGGVPVYRYPVPSRPTRDEARGRVRAYGAEKLRAWLERERPHVVHVHSITTGLQLHELEAARAVAARVIVTAHTARLGWLCPRGTLMRFGEARCDGRVTPRRCATCVLDAHGLPRPIGAALASLPRTAARLAARLPGRAATAVAMPALVEEDLRAQDALYRLADKVVLLTRAALEIAVANGAPRERLALNRLGASQPGARKPARATRAPVRFGYVGRFEPVKGAHDLVRAVASLPPELPLELALRGPVNGSADRIWREELEALAAGDPRIRVLPAVPPEEVPAVLAELDVLVCPARCFEGGPTVALEAQAVGTPVVGTAIGGLAELVTTHADERLVPADDGAALAALIARIARQPARIDAWRATLEPVRTMNDVAQDYLSLYQAAA